MTDANVNPHPLINGVPPIWAAAWGKDEFGVYASSSVGGVSRRLRWIPPGRFWMGSSEGEVERYDERPRHQVTIASGFWMIHGKSAYQQSVPVQSPRRAFSRVLTESEYIVTFPQRSPP
jgi:hypothetical protein